MRLYSVVFDFQHNKWVIFNLFLIWYFFQTQPKSDVFLLKLPVRGLYWSDVCLSPMFVYQSDVCIPVRRLSQSDDCLSPTFVSVRRLFTSPTFVLVRRLYTSPTFVSVRRFYTTPTFVTPTFVLSDLCGSDVWTGTKRISKEK